MDDGVGKLDHLVLHQAADVVRMHVGQQNVVDVGGAIAGSLQVAHQLAERRSEQVAGAGIDQDQALAGVDQVGVVGGFLRRLQEGVVQRSHRFRGRLVQQLVHRQIHRAIAERGDLEIAQHEAVIARRRCLGHRRRGEGAGRREPQKDGCGGGTEDVAAEVGTHVFALVVEGGAMLSICVFHYNQ